MRSLDANASVLDVLRTESNNLAAPRCSLYCKLHDEPLLRAERPVAPVLRDLVIGPGMVAFALRQLDPGDAFSWIVLSHSRHGDPHEPANSLEPMAFRGWLPD